MPEFRAVDADPEGLAIGDGDGETARRRRHRQYAKTRRCANSLVTRDILEPLKRNAQPVDPESRDRCRPGPPRGVFGGHFVARYSFFSASRAERGRSKSV